LNGFAFLRSRPAQLLTGLLVLQAAVFYGRFRTTELIPLVRPLAEFPAELGPWRAVRNFPIEQQVQDVLKADDTLSRSYTGPGVPGEIHLFMAYFKSQRYGQKPHSPQNCLPGSGWEAMRKGFRWVDIPGRAPIEVNRYLVQRGTNKSMVLYFYLSHNRVVASEYWAQIWVVADGIRYNRSDTSIVKVVLPADNISAEQAEESSARFIQAIFPQLERYFPG